MQTVNEETAVSLSLLEVHVTVAVAILQIANQSAAKS